MRTLGELIDAAIRSSGKTAREIAQKVNCDVNTISRLRTGKEVNPKLQLLMGIARETGTTVPALLGASFEISREDEGTLQTFRDWIDRKLATLDALRESNAEIVHGPRVAATGDRLIADEGDERFETPFGVDAHLVLRAIGDSMVEDGILADDTVYAVAPDVSPAGRVIACRLGEKVFVKRLISEHGRRYLMSAHPRYRLIDVDGEGLSLEILGIVIGRSGLIA